jgi:hypothetical protein
MQFGNLTRLSLKGRAQWSNEGTQLLEPISQLHSLEDLEMNINIHASSVRGLFTTFLLEG